MATTEQLWGGETAKAVENFPVSGNTIPVPVIRALGRIKAAAARANAELGLLDGERAAKISGSMFTMYRGWGARLLRAMVQLSLDRNADDLAGSGDRIEADQLLIARARAHDMELRPVDQDHRLPIGWARGCQLGARRSHGGADRRCGSRAAAGDRHDD